MRNLFFKFRKLLIIIVITGGVSAGIAFTNDKFEVTKNLDILISTVKELDNYYVDDIDAGKLIKKGIDAMLESLDPYTNFIPESDASDYQFMTSGSYGGVGAVVSKNGDYVLISETYEGFPAQKAGLRAGDILMQIDAKSTKYLTVSDVSTLLKGQPDTKVEILVRRQDIPEPFKVSLTRQNIHVNNVPYYGMVSDSVGYILLTNFRENASDEVRKAFVDMKSSGKLKGVILDLRYNPGGLLYEAVKIVNLFVDRGQLIVSTKGKIENSNKDYKAMDNPVDKDIPLIVLVNENSASASEIVSGALQDLDRAVIIGNRTFGKGLVQITRKLPYNAQLKLTTSKYYIPSGRCIQALDYTHKDANGRAVKVADSLIRSFKTLHGRPVYDGAGIRPDIKITDDKNSEISNALLSQHVIFDYSTYFRNRHESIALPDKFSLSDQDYTDFLTYVEGKNISYKTTTEKALEKMRDEAKTENYYDALKSNYDSISSKIQVLKKKELYVYKSEISEMLNEEIASRYYFQKGRIIAGLRTDKDIAQAVRLISNQSIYYSTLSPEAKKQ